MSGQTLTAVFIWAIKWHWYGANLNSWFKHLRRYNTIVILIYNTLMHVLNVQLLKTILRHTHTRTHAHACMHTHTHTDPHIRMHACTHAQTCTHERMYIHTHTRTCMHTHTHPPPPTHTLPAATGRWCTQNGRKLFSKMDVSLDLKVSLASGREFNDIMAVSVSRGHRGQQSSLQKCVCVWREGWYSMGTLKRRWNGHTGAWWWW